MHLSPLVLLLVVFQLVQCGPSRTVHEKRVTHSKSFTSHRRAATDVSLPLKVYLRQSNIHLLEELLYKISDPISEGYGQHWTPDEVRETFMPSGESINAVKQWLEQELESSEDANPLTRVKLAYTGTHLYANVTVEEAERLLNTQYHIFKHVDGSEHLACDHYSLPSHLVDHIKLVTPGVNLIPRGTSRISRCGPMPEKSSRIFRSPKIISLDEPRASFPTPQNLSGCDSLITPACLIALYGINYTPRHTDKNTFAIAEFTPQSYVSSDLKMFFQQFSPKSVGQDPILVSIDGGVPTSSVKDSFDINGESDLDFEYGMTLTAPQPVQLYQAGDPIQGASFTNMLDALDKSYCGPLNPNFDGIYPDPAPGGFDHPQSCGIAKPAHVISISYGGDEPDVTPAYQEHECQEYGKLGLMGTTILFASGDDGVAGNDELCILPNRTQSVNGTRFNPSWPLTCPFVTAVGATQVNPGATVDDPESAANQVIFSGGGFSDIYAMPAYQRAAVDSYFKNHKPPYSGAQYNNSQNSRGYPDLSANGVNYVIAIDGNFSLVFGTSASTPVVASMITLVNDARIGAGKGPVGFINPALYSPAFQGIFHDITSGNNPGCGTEGFEAVPGWDPVTGLGTPNFPQMMDAFMKLP